jgi:flagellar FliL protein
MGKKPEKKEADAGAADGAAGSGSKKKLMIFGGAGLAVVLIGGGAAAFFLGLFGGAKPKEMAGDPAHPAAQVKAAMFVDLPEMVVNLSSIDQHSAFLKLRVSLEVSQKETIEKIQPVLPRVLDAFQVYLRELRSTDLEGSAGTFRVKEELQRRVNIAIYPARVEAVLFKEIMIQ